mmetsp:Transcript_25359/g.58536  ORF Transcript_25359/g.58536 Transcript_25359/m.58536 type:complete len:807 (+) Transcript_25359:242-2662(+)
MADLAATLLACQNPDPNIRNAAEQALLTAEQNNLPQFMTALIQELGTEGRDINGRQLAGLHLKNLLAAKDSTIRATKVQTWRDMDPAGKVQIKASLLQILSSSEYTARHTAAQAAAEIAAIDLPESAWPELIPYLLKTVTDSGEDSLKTTALECLGFTSERLDSDEIDQATINLMLTAIVDGIRPDRSNDIRLAAAVALRHSLLFTRSNFDNKSERDMIMQTICEATQCTDQRVRSAAYECIVQIAFCYYEKLTDYMTTLAQLTFGAISGEQDEVAMQAVEFWSTLCEEEIDIMDETADLTEQGIPAQRVSSNYISAALEHLVPLLVKTLTKQDDDVDDDQNWNLAMAGATCIGLISNTVEDQIVDVIMPFVLQNIKNTEWRMREAATMAFSCILEGPSTDKIGQFVNQSIPVLIEALKDPHPMVKDTSAWTLGRICDLHVRCIPNEALPQLVQGLASVLMTESPSVSSKACFALHNLAAAFDAETGSSNALSPYVGKLLETLLAVTEREDWEESNLRFSAYEAVNMLIKNSAQDCKPILIQMLPLIIERLKATFSMTVLTNEEKEAKEGLQGLLCGVIQVTTQHLGSDVGPFANSIMENLLKVFESRNATAHGEAYLAIAALANELEGHFNIYMSHLHAYLMMGLRNAEAYQICSVAVGVVGDIARAIESQIQPFCNEIMTSLLENLQNPNLNRSVKPDVLSCIGDVALAINGAFEPYLQATLTMLLQASQTKAPDDDDDLIEYVNGLREGILEAYTGIIQGLKDGNKVDLLVPYTEHMMGFLEMLANDPNHDEAVLRTSIGCLG